MKDCDPTNVAAVRDATEWRPVTRCAVFMLLEAATWGGSMTGPILGGKIALLFGLRAPFACAFILLCVAFVMLLLGYKETLDDTKRK